MEKGSIHQSTSGADVIEIVDENLKAGFAQLPRPVLRAKGLSFRAKLLYVALLDYAWERGSCFPGHDKLAKDLDTSHDTVRRALAELRDYGLIRWKQQGLNKPNVYYLLRLSDCPGLGLSKAEDADLRHPEDADLRVQESAELRHKEYSKKNTHTTSKYSKVETSESKSQPHNGQNKSGGGLASISELLARRASLKTRSSLGGVDGRIAELISTWSHEWHDDHHLRSNLTQARHIQEFCGWSIEAFTSSLYQAHSTTMQDGHGARNKMAYFFVVLRDLVGAEHSNPSERGLGGGEGDGALAETRGLRRTSTEGAAAV